MRTLALAMSAGAAVQAANPIRRVVTLLQEMQSEIETEGKKEEELYENFMCFCKGNTENMSKAADEAASQIEELNAKVKQEKAEKKTTESELKQHKIDRSQAQQDLAKATAIRKKEAEAYAKAAGETKQNIDDTNAAITALSKGMGGGAFVQTTAGNKLSKLMDKMDGSFMMDGSERELVVSFLSQSGDYIPASGQIVGILKNMKDEMDKSLGGIVGEEESAVSGFKELKAAKQKEIAAASKAIEAKTARIGNLAVSIVQNQNAADDATDELDDANKFAANLTVQCNAKSADWDERSKTRTEEVAAIGEAISVLNNDDALDTFNAAIPKPNTPATAFLQRSNKKAQMKGDAAVKVRTMLKSDMFAKNPALNLLAHTIRQKLKQGSGVDFSTVVKMIDDMVALLKKEQHDDEEHLNFCNVEFDRTEDEIKDVKTTLEELASSISEMKDEIANLSENIATLTADNAALDKSVAEATKQRKEEHADFTQKIQLNDAAVQLIFKAKNRLNKFYNPAMYKEAPKREQTAEDRAIEAAGGTVDYTVRNADGTASDAAADFIQIEQKSTIDPPKAPETYGEHKTKGKKATGVVALMDMLANDVKKDSAESENSEKTAQKEYAELIADAQESRAQNSKSITDKEGAKADTEGRLQNAKSENIIASDQHQTLVNYDADLHHSCDFITANFEIRRQARDQEATSLKNAKAVLSGADFA